MAETKPLTNVCRNPYCWCPSLVERYADECQTLYEPRKQRQQNCPICGGFLPLPASRDEREWACPKCGTEFSL